MTKYTNINADSGGTHGVYQGTNRNQPLMTGSFDDCTNWCRGNGDTWDAEAEAWNSGHGPSRAIHHVKAIQR